MTKRKISTALRRMALAATLAAASSVASAAVIHVAVDTSYFGVASGYLDMQLTPGAPLTTALVNHMVGFDPNAFIDAVGVTQTAGGYLFRNDTFTDLFHAVDFGGVLSFDLTFDSVIDPIGKFRSVFLISAFDEDFAFLGNTNPRSGSLAEFTWIPAATNGIDGNIGVSITDPSVTFIPEPVDSILMGAGLAIMALVLRRRANPVVPPRRTSAGMELGRVV